MCMHECMCIGQRIKRMTLPFVRSDSLLFVPAYPRLAGPQLLGNVSSSFLMRHFLYFLLDLSFKGSAPPMFFGLNLTQ